MKKVLLVHQDTIQHYRVSIYNYISEYLFNRDFQLKVVSQGIQADNPYPPLFDFTKTPLTFITLFKWILTNSPSVVILFVNPKNKYLFPLMVFIKMAHIKLIYWGHGIDLQNKTSLYKLAFNKLQHSISDGLILYAEHLKEYINPMYHKKCFIANNTLNFSDVNIPDFNKQELLLSYGIKTIKNIIFSGRIQKRKRLGDLIAAFEYIDLKNTGLIIVGPHDRDVDISVLENKKNIYYIGPCYGNKVLMLLQASEVYCIPGAIGLSIVDAQFCGLPIVTEDVDHGPEIMYLQNGQNGFIVPKGNIQVLADRLRLLLIDDNLRAQFAESAKNTAATNAHIDRMCEGFFNCLQYVLK